MHKPVGAANKPKLLANQNWNVTQNTSPTFYSLTKNCRLAGFVTRFPVNAIVAGNLLLGAMG